MKGGDAAQLRLQVGSQTSHSCVNSATYSQVRPVSLGGSFEFKHWKDRLRVRSDIQSVELGVAGSDHTDHHVILLRIVLYMSGLTCSPPSDRM